MYLFFDTETTGLPKRWNAPVTDLENWPRLVQLAWIMYDDRGNMLESRDVIVKPKDLLFLRKLRGCMGSRLWWHVKRGNLYKK